VCVCVCVCVCERERGRQAGEERPTEAEIWTLMHTETRGCADTRRHGKVVVSQLPNFRASDGENAVQKQDRDASNLALNANTLVCREVVLWDLNLLSVLGD
jgi:hypothetical protein